MTVKTSLTCPSEISTTGDDLGTALLGGAALVALFAPGAVIGAILAYHVWRRRRMPMSARWGTAIISVLLFLLFQSAVLWEGLWSVIGDLLFLKGAVVLSLGTQALAGPLVLQTALHVQASRRTGLSPSTSKTTPPPSGDTVPPSSASRQREERRSGMAHPPGAIRLGTDLLGRPYDLSLTAELRQHLFCPGLIGTGKTTTLVRIVDGALAAGYGIVVLDCKGSGGFGSEMQRRAAAWQVPWYAFDLGDPHTYGYNPCMGDPATVANKLIGAFNYIGSAEVYKHIVMDVLPVIVAALQAAGQPVTLDTLYDAFEPNALLKMAKAAGEPYTRRLVVLQERAEKDHLIKSGYVGLQKRLGALREGAFGPLFRSEKQLSWDAALAQQSLTYLALSVLGSSEDVELLGRVMAQDLKQVANTRLRAIKDGADLAPVLIVVDEFAALREADQLVDLLLQGREARFSLVVASQLLPESLPLRKALLGAGVIISHRVEGKDAEVLAAQFGTRQGTDVTRTVNMQSGEVQSGSVRSKSSFNVTPDQLRELGTGCVAVRSVNRPISQRHMIVSVYREEEDDNGIGA